MLRVSRAVMAVSFLGIALTACQAQHIPETVIEPAQMRFSGQRALALETEFVTNFPSRQSGQPNNRLAAGWLLEQFTTMGYDCTIDRWEVINYSRRFPLNNVVCRLPGQADKEILVIAHLDQAPTTIQGADNDGSGIAILLELGEIFAAEPDPRYTLALVATDGEEYGMLGSRRYIQTHPNPEEVLAGISLDNLGWSHYNGVDTDPVGQFHGYGPVWLSLVARQAARAAGADWEVHLTPILDQITDQAAPVSFMDQGPLVAAGVPAVGLAGHVPAEFGEAHFNIWHDPSDSLDKQTAAALGQSGLIAEALIRQLMGMESFPHETGPYLYFDESGQVLRGAALWAILVGFVALFFLASLLTARRPAAEMVRGWRRALPHLLGLWLPLVAAIVLLYVMVAVGLMDKYYLYPATSKDPLLYHPRWPAVILFVLGLGLLLYLGRRLAARADAAPQVIEVRSLALLVIGVGGLYVLAMNPFGLFFMVPLIFWLLITVRTGIGKTLDILLFVLGGLFVYALIYFFGFLVLRLNFAMLWYMLNMFSVGMISFPMAAVVMGILAAGLSVIVNVPRVQRRA